MGLIRQFAAAAPYKVFFSVLLGILAGIFYSALIPLVISSIEPADPAFPELNRTLLLPGDIEVSDPKMAMLYLFACIVVLLTRSLSEIMLLQVGARVARNFRMSFYQRISATSVVALEKAGSARLIGAVNLDVPRIVLGARLIPAIFVNSVTLIGMLGFLLYLNASVFKLVVLSVVAGILVYQLPMIFGRRLFEKNRELNDQLQESIKGLIYGAKELKLDQHKSTFYHNLLLKAQEEKLLRTESVGHAVTRATVSLGDLLSFFVIGVVSFIALNHYTIASHELVSIVMALLYITTPIAIVLNSIPGLTVAGVSYRKLHRLLGELPTEGCDTTIVPVAEWQTLQFVSVCYRYPSYGEEAGFAVGPIDLEIHRGEITFIVGGNGSGKSTLSKLITLHYQATTGDIVFGNQKVAAQQLNSFRHEISAIFSNYYLFDRLLSDLTREKEQKLQQYLVDLKLAHLVKVTDGKFSTTALSDGQRKRLALVVAYLDDKNLYLFDEWAADQDPEFKEIFYRQILPDLKASGKAVVVISHDDKYFPLADQLLKMDGGRLISIRRDKSVALASCQ
ncbi:cyclic peptide transporter [Rheinheimera sp. SA_1]|uniref:cyclic peptide export ABC transporter n=1 Tax=Rheinheimera sp. SA_1 TaxID=1827365 RepID=UPI0007FF9EBA|nr:cyclic peptide export ABC transporter [Rheinheimera sp. SA_1]OBP16556.1 cyclic peptide transporter [Rheinheimera sp. SA_1]